MAFGVLLRPQWISGYIEFVPDWSELPVGVSVSVNIDATKALDSHRNVSTISSVAIDAAKTASSTGDRAVLSNVAIDVIKAFDSRGNVPAIFNVAIDATKAIDSHGNVSAISNVAIDATKALDPHENASTVSNVAIDVTTTTNSTGNKAVLSNVAIDAAKTTSSAGNRASLSNIAFDRIFISGPGYGTADVHGVTDLLKALTTSNSLQAAITLLTTLSKTLATDQHVTAGIASGTDLRYTIAITPSLVPPLVLQPPLFKNLSIVSAECPDLLEIEPSDELVEGGEFEQTTMETDSGLTYIVTSRPTPKYYVTLQWKGLKQTDVDKVTSIYFTTTKAFGRARSFKWKHPVDNKVYVVRFVGDLNTDRRAEIANRESIGSIQLEILGISAN